MPSSAILKSYELVSGVYRQKFRNHRKLKAQNYEKILRQKETYFGRWNTMKNVQNEYERLKQLILIDSKTVQPKRLKFI